MSIDDYIKKQTATLENLRTERDAIDRRIREEREWLNNLYEQKFGLVRDETIVVNPKGKRGVYVAPYREFDGTALGQWVRAREIKKDGKPGKRIRTFYSWSIE